MQDIQIGRVYRHFKGDYYLVEGVAQHSETGELSRLQSSPFPPSCSAAQSRNWNR